MEPRKLVGFPFNPPVDPVPDWETWECPHPKNECLGVNGV